ncbi:hypothetical protein CGCVW01_v007498 [Colletotrichum viniferum]|nr:hypothetical protein CGCVW01_v007498 [Colletotrichum viniferum]
MAVFNLSPRNSSIQCRANNGLSLTAGSAPALRTNGVPLDWRCLSLPEHNVPSTDRTSTEMQLLTVQDTLQSLNLPKDSCCRPTTPWHS